MAAVVAMMLVFSGGRRQENTGASRAFASVAAGATRPNKETPSPRNHRAPSPEAAAAPVSSAEEVVTGKVRQFGRARRETARTMGNKAGKDMPPAVEQFFDAVERGQWDEIKSRWDVLAKQSGQYEGSNTNWEALNPFWPAVLDAYGVAEQAHLWPAQKLLDYGNAVLGSLRPGMVYVGGTDNGRWIPELLNETSGGEPHIIVTQNGLADGRYLDFVNTLYQDRMNTLSSDDSQKVYQDYLANAQKRLEHDQQFPDEPKQVLPGENIRVEDGKVQLSGATVVMAINGKLLDALMQKNPDMSFAIQESIPLKGTYADALPLGPLMELSARNDDNQFTAERAAQSLQYWQAAAQQQLSDPEAANSDAAMKSYSHDAVAAANLLAAHNFGGEAEQAYRLATQLWPGNPESVGGLADLLAANGRESEARQMLQDYARKYPDEKKNLELTSSLWRLVGSAQAAK
jgi:hypothetical protein